MSLDAGAWHSAPRLRHLDCRLRASGRWQGGWLVSLIGVLLALKEKTHRPGGFFSERSEEVELPAAGAKILKIVLCTWKLVRGLNARQNPYQKKRRSLSLSLFSLLFSSFLFFSPSFSLSLFSLLLYFYSSCYLPSVFCLLSAVAVTFVIAIVSTADANYLPANLRQGANF